MEISLNGEKSPTPAAQPLPPVIPLLLPPLHCDWLLALNYHTNHFLILFSDSAQPLLLS